MSVSQSVRESLRVLFSVDVFFSHSGALHELEFESSSHQLMVMNKEKEKEMKKVLNANELRLPVLLSVVVVCFNSLFPSPLVSLSSVSNFGSSASCSVN